MKPYQLGIGGHHRGFRGQSDEWLTPPELINTLGPFDLDPCAAVDQPYRTAARVFTINQNGLAQEWKGRVWLNPPYGPMTGAWLQRLADHRDGIALIFARTETVMFHQYVWKRADAVFFFLGRLHFHRPDGSRAKGGAGGPSCLVAYGEKNSHCLNCVGMPGHLVILP